MRSIVCCVVGLVLLLTACACLKAAAESADPGSFLRHKVRDARELAGQIVSDKTVAARFSRHYGVPAGDVARCVREDLKLVKLGKTQRFKVYFISKDGSIKGKLRMLKAGTLVYTTADGEPFMVANCGNPLTKALPLRKPVVEVKPALPIEVSQAAVVIEPAVAAVIQPTVALPATPVLAPGLPALPLLGAVVPMLAGAVKVENDGLPPVPEPSVAMAMLTGLGCLAAARIGRRRL